MTVGAQGPIRSRFDTLRRRSVRVGTVVKSATRVRGIVGAGTGAVFVELVAQRVGQRAAAGAVARTGDRALARTPRGGDS